MVIDLKEFFQAVTFNSRLKSSEDRQADLKGRLSIMCADAATPEPIKKLLRAFIQRELRREGEQPTRAGA